MVQEIKTISFGGVNCYLLITEKGFVLIDTGFSNNHVEKALKRYKIEGIKWV